MPFKGSFPALITPMKNGEVDELAFRKFVNWQIEQGSHGLVPVGTTGESPTLTPEEHKRVIEICIEEARGRVPVIAGTGSNSTMEAIEYTIHAKEAGANAALVVVPYYNKPTQDGLYAHFKAIADAVDIPIIVYNVPGRTVANISVETLARLVADCKNIIGTKDASADLTRPSRQRLISGKDFIQLSGEDGTALGFNAHGGVGCISVTANVAPRLCCGVPGGDAEGRLRRRPEAAGPADAAASCHVRGNQPRAGEICREPAWPVRAGSAAADGAGGRIDQEGGARGDDPRRAPELT